MFERLVPPSLIGIVAMTRLGWWRALSAALIATGGAAEPPAAAARFVIGPATSYRGADLVAVATAVRRESDRLLEAMARRDPEAVKRFYGPNDSYIGKGGIGDWATILAGTADRYATRTSVACRWGDPFRIDVLSRDIALVTANLRCDLIDRGAKQSDTVARLEVLQRFADGWKIVALTESLVKTDRAAALGCSRRCRTVRG